MVSPQGPSSFIPKTPTNKVKNKPRGVRKIYVFTYLSLVLFFGTLIASASIFFFHLTVTAQLAEQKEDLAAQRNAFDDRPLNNLKTLDNRIENAKRLLSTHVSVLGIFESLERSTIESVQLTGFEYERSEFGSIEVKLNASTEDMNSARFQRDIYESDTLLKKVDIISPKLTAREEQLSGDTQGREEVIFSLSGNLLVSDIVYTAPDVVAEEDLYSDAFPVSTTTEAEMATGTEEVADDESEVEEEQLETNDVSN